MEMTPLDLEHILCHNISGFHRYCFGGVPYLCYVSQNLCRMLGCSVEALLDDRQDRYAQQIHPSDRQRYDDMLREVGRETMTRTVQYRLIRMDGTVIHVSDTITSYLQDGTMVADSVLTDITQLQSENRNLRFLDETIPCGFLRYTCEKTPRITYINDQMLRFLRFPEKPSAGFDDLEMYRQNIYMMIPMEERRRFAVYLDRVYKHGAPIAGEMTVLRCDGTKAYLFGWVTKCVNEEGMEEFQSACMDITQRHNIRKEREIRRYLKVLSDVYDKIFEYDLQARTVKCLHGHSSAMFRWIEDIPMQMEEATEKWISETVFEEDRERVRSFFEDFYQRRLQESESPPEIRYRALSSSGALRSYNGLFVKIDGTISLFCCRGQRDKAVLGSEKDMQELVARFTDGIAAFEILEDAVTPLYASDNVCRFFGYSKEEWLSIMKKRTPIRQFVANSRATYDDFLGLLAKGEAGFTYHDLDSGRDRRIRAICSQRSPGGTGPRYVMLYEVDDAQEETVRTGVEIRTFGYFDVFVDGKPIAFRNEKAKELLALLVDRRGGFVSSEEAISFLWEDEPADPVTLARYRKVALRLKNLLEEYGIADVIESVNGKRRLVTEKVRCDLYEHLSGRGEAGQSFKGSYLTNYSWGENTLAELMGEHIFRELDG